MCYDGHVHAQLFPYVLTNITGMTLLKEGRIVYFHSTKLYEGAKVLPSPLDGCVWSVPGRFTPG